MPPSPHGIISASSSTTPTTRAQTWDHPSASTSPLLAARYSHSIGRESIFGKMLFGEGWLNKNWAANGAIGTIASFTIYAGGGIDTPPSRHFSLRVEGGVEHTNFALQINRTSLFPYYRIPGLPKRLRAFLHGHRMGSPSGSARERGQTAIDHTTGAARI